MVLDTAFELDDVELPELRRAPPSAPIIADAVNQVTADGALYFSSAGNSGNLNDGTAVVWQGDFSSTPPPSGLTGTDTHDFGGGDSLNTITVDSPSFFVLQWADPQGGAGNDNSARNTFGVAAVDWSTAGGSPFTCGPANPVETFSSDGRRRLP